LKKITQEVNAFKKELYLKHSIEYIDKVGHKNFKISQLAKELNTSVGTIYNLFESKEELYLQYLIFKLKHFLKRLKEHEINDAMKNLECYLQYKYEIFMQIDKNKPLVSDPYFFHKLDIANHDIVIDIYAFLQRQFQQLDGFKKKDYLHEAILFKKLSDGFIESYVLQKYDIKDIVQKTMKNFFYGVIKQ
jgi:AcrR family transcriptional regulator